MFIKSTIIYLVIPVLQLLEQEDVHTWNNQSEAPERSKQIITNPDFLIECDLIKKKQSMRTSCARRFCTLLAIQ